MTQPLFVTILGIIPFLCGAYLVYVLLRFGHREKHLPPGPPTIPILGNAHLIPKHGVPEKFKEWSNEYGGIFSLKIGRGTIIVLNDRRMVHDLIDKRNAIYWQRPLDPHVDSAIGANNFAMGSTNPLWKHQRKIASQGMAPKILDEIVAPIQEAEIAQFLQESIDAPQDHFIHVKRVTSSIGSIILFGHRGPTMESFWAHCVWTVMDSLNIALEAGAGLPIEQFPILKYVPEWLAPSKAQAKQAYMVFLSMWTDAVDRVTKRRDNGDYRASMADRILSGEVKMDVPFTKDEICSFLGTMHQGAADTTMSMILSHILLLAKYPHFQERARQELDAVCGCDRMPLWSDFKNLPYINCIMKEGLRFRPVLRGGVPHRASRDDWYEGYLIPKDSTVFFPPWALHQTCYDDAGTYNPNRYLNHPRLAMDYAGSPDYENRDHYAYGAGRRICAGIHFAERTQWRVLAKLLWACEIKPALNADGDEIELDENAYTQGFLTQPKPYHVRFILRSEKHMAVVREASIQGRNALKKWD